MANGSFTLKATDILMQEHGINQMGRVQQHIDNECVRLMSKYTPIQANSGTLRNSASIHSVIGSGKIIQRTPYARYQYYGEVYGNNYPIRNGKISYNPQDGEIERWASSKVKHPTGRKINYNKSINPNAQSHWFEVMKKFHAKQILDGARRIAKGI